MRVCIYTGNHGNSLGISDLVRLLKQGAIDCGHDAVVSHELLPGHCNILIEHFNEDAHLAHLRERKTADTRCVMVCTELITGSTFNGGMGINQGHYSNQAYWQKRYNGFQVAAQLMDFIWVLSELAIAPYAAELPDKPVRFLPHGYVSGMDLVTHRDEADKDIDFYFSGGLTDYRRAILSELARTHRLAYNAQNTPDYLRLDQMARTKVCLSLPLSPENELPSVSRMHFHLQNRSFLIHEAHAKSSILDPYVMHAPHGDLIEWARAALDLPNRREIANGIHVRFKNEMPITRWMRPLLDEAMGQPATARPASAAQAA
jgi:hypothetical protein